MEEERRHEAAVIWKKILEKDQRFLKEIVKEFCTIMYSVFLCPINLRTVQQNVHFLLVFCGVGSVLGDGDEVSGMVMKCQVWSHGGYGRGRVDVLAVHLYWGGDQMSVFLKTSQVMSIQSQGWGPLTSSCVPHIIVWGVYDKTPEPFFTKVVVML